MTCAFETVTEQWLSGFRARTAAERTPVSAHFELTRRCNLHCRHCYLTAAERHGERCAEELTTAAVKAALNEWAAAGVLFLTLSGGEPLLRKDFADIYRYARELGLVVRSSQRHAAHGCHRRSLPRAAPAQSGNQPLRRHCRHA